MGMKCDKNSKKKEKKWKTGGPYGEKTEIEIEI
jgi:hypothetical protein